MKDTRKKSIVGPTHMYVGRGPIISAVAAIPDGAGPAEALAQGKEMLAEIAPEIAYLIWLRHRLRMAVQRQTCAAMQALHAGQWFRGPRPDLIATKPWDQARYGEWLSVPHGVAARLISETPPKLT